MASSVVLKKTEKLAALALKYGKKITLEEFKKLFKEEYPKDWARIKTSYKIQVLIPKEKGKKPRLMPKPYKFLEDMYKSFQGNGKLKS